MVNRRAAQGFSKEGNASDLSVLWLNRQSADAPEQAEDGERWRPPALRHTEVELSMAADTKEHWAAYNLKEILIHTHTQKTTLGLENKNVLKPEEQAHELVPG